MELTASDEVIPIEGVVLDRLIPKIDAHGTTDGRPDSDRPNLSGRLTTWPLCRT